MTSEGVRARLEKLGYAHVAEIKEIENAITRILFLPGVSNDPVTAKAVNEIVKGLFGNADSEGGPQGTPQGNDNRGTFHSDGSGRVGRRTTDVLPSL